MNKAYALCLATVMMWGAVINSFRYAVSIVEANPIVFALFALFIAGGTLIIIAGPGHLGVNTIRRPHTWLYGIFQIILAIFEIGVTKYVTATEASLLLRFGIPLSLLITWIFLKRKPLKTDLIGVLIILAGIWHILGGINNDIKAPLLFFVIGSGIFLTIRTLIAETHPESQQANSIKDRCRVTGYVLLVTNLFSIIMFYLIASFKTPALITEMPALNIFPSSSDFFLQPMILASIIVGAIFWAPAMYFYFYAAKEAKTEQFMIFTAFMPIFTLFFEFILSLFTKTDITEISRSDLFAGLIIIIGASFMVIMRNKKAKKSKVIESSI